MSETLEVNVDDVIEVATAEPAPKQFRLLAWTNDKSNEAVIKQLEMFYQIVIHNQLGIMHARNDETGETETLLVGIDPNTMPMDTYPLAKILGPEDVNKYSPPDGNGGYLSDEVPTEH